MGVLSSSEATMTCPRTPQTQQRSQPASKEERAQRGGEAGEARTEGRQGRQGGKHLRGDFGVPCKGGARRLVDSVGEGDDRSLLPQVPDHRRAAGPSRSQNVLHFGVPCHAVDVHERLRRRTRSVHVGLLGVLQVPDQNLRLCGARGQQVGLEGVEVQAAHRPFVLLNACYNWISLLRFDQLCRVPQPNASVHHASGQNAV
eukprot:3791763-Rhodomonas_salina.1